MEIVGGNHSRRHVCPRNLLHGLSIQDQHEPGVAATIQHNRQQHTVVLCLAIGCGNKDGLGGCTLVLDPKFGTALGITFLDLVEIHFDDAIVDQGPVLARTVHSVRVTVIAQVIAWVQGRQLKVDGAIQLKDNFGLGGFGRVALRVSSDRGLLGDVAEAVTTQESLLWRLSRSLISKVVNVVITDDSMVLRWKIKNVRIG